MLTKKQRKNIDRFKKQYSIITDPKTLEHKARVDAMVFLKERKHKSLKGEY